MYKVPIISIWNICENTIYGESPEDIIASKYSLVGLQKSKILSKTFLTLNYTRKIISIQE